MAKPLAGADRLIRNLRTLAREYPNDVAAAAYEEMEIEMAEMKARTPVDTGALRASGHVNPPEARGREIRIQLGFGGPGLGYAIPVHENTEAFHPVGQSKYVESVLDEGRPYYAQRIAARVDPDRRVR